MVRPILGDYREGLFYASGVIPQMWYAPDSVRSIHIGLQYIVSVYCMLKAWQNGEKWSCAGSSIEVESRILDPTSVTNSMIQQKAHFVLHLWVQRRHIFCVQQEIENYDDRNNGDPRAIGASVK